MSRVKLASLNALDLDDFVRVAESWFESSPWIAARTWPQRPFTSLEELHNRLCATMYAADLEEQLQLISAHPDLVGRAARAGTLTSESTREQASAGLGNLAPEEIAAFDRYNAAYRGKFGFPFVICARENKKQAILAAFPLRLANSRDQEIGTALAEIAKISWLRMSDDMFEEGS